MPIHSHHFSWRFSLRRFSLWISLRRFSLRRFFSRRNLASNQCGATILEMAYVLPVFLLLIMGIMEFSLRFFADVVLQSGIQEASRFGAVGKELAGSSREDTIRQIILENSYGLFESSQLTLTYKVYDSFDNIDKPEPFNDSNRNGRYDFGETYTDTNGNGRWDPDQGSTGLGSGNDVVLYEASHPWDAISPIMEPFLGNTKVSARIAVRNEPF